MDSTESKAWEVNPNGSKWLAENLKGMDQSVKRMLKLIEEDGSSTNNELIANVEEFHQLYRTLAERYDHLSKELCKSTTQGSGESESGYDPDSLLQTPDAKVALRKLNDGSAGSDISPGSPGADSVFSLKAESGSSSASSSDSDSESFVTSYLRTPLSINSQSMHQKMGELETELSAMKDKLQLREADLGLERERALELQSRVVELEARVLDTEHMSGMLVGELEVARNMLMGFEEEIAKLKSELRERTVEGVELQNQLGLAWEERAMIEAQLGSEKELVLELEEMIARYNADLSDRDLEVWELKVALRDAEEQFYQEKARLDQELKESEQKTLVSEAEKTEIQTLLNAQVTALQDQSNHRRTELVALMTEKDGLSTKLETLLSDLSARDYQLLQLRSKHEKLTEESRKAQKLIEELEPRVEELQREVDGQRAVISEAAEEKREAIRQLCFSLEHYRSGYQELRQAFVGARRNVVMAA